MGKEKYLDISKDESHETSALTGKKYTWWRPPTQVAEQKWLGIGKYFLLSLIGGLGTLLKNMMQEKFDASEKNTVTVGR